MITPSIADQLTVHMFDDAHRQTLRAQWGWRRRTRRSGGGPIADEVSSYRHPTLPRQRRGSPLAAR